jgi:hypothetical protein
MITISQRVEELVERWPMLKQGLELDLLNTSAVARYLKPVVEKVVGEKVSEAAVLMALRRYEDEVENSERTKPESFLGDISLRSNLIDLTYTNSPTIQRRIAKLVHDLEGKHYLTSSRGLLQTSIIVHEDHLGYVQEGLENEHLEQCIPDLTAITLHLKEGHDNVSGILAYPLHLLDWRGVPVVELVSTYDELNIILYDKDVETAFSVLNSSIS